MNSKERKELISEFYRIYRRLQQNTTLKMHAHFDSKENYIEIWEHKNNKAVKNICRVREEEETACWKRALEDLARYEKMLQESD